MSRIERCPSLVLCSLLVAASLLAAACDDGGSDDDPVDTTTSADVAGGDTAAPDADADTDADTSTPDATVGDASDTGDAQSDLVDTVDDTDAADLLDMRDVVVDPDDPFASIRVTGIQGVALCNQWNDGNDLATERARQVRIVMGDGLPNLGRDTVAEPLVLDSIARGPWADLQRHDAEVESTVTTYEVTPENGGHRLELTASWPLGENLGVLDLDIRITRPEGDTSPVNLAEGVARFVYQAPGGEVAVLWPCEGSADLEDAVEVLVGQDANGEVSVVRYSRTLATDAGSAPVALRLHELRFSEDAFRVHAFEGHWSQTYVASHHNVDDETVLDAEANAFHHQMWLGQHPHLTDVMQPVLREVAFDAVNTFEGGGAPTPTIRAELEVPATGAVSSRSYETLDRMWRRVDTPHLLREYAGECPAAELEVVGVGGYGSLFQLVTCEDASEPTGTSLRAIVPVLFDADMTRIGVPVTSFTGVTADGRPGWTADIGSHELELTWDGDGAQFFMYLRDAQGDTVIGQLAEPQPTLEPHFGERETFSLRSSDGRVTFEFERQWVAQGVGESSIFAPLHAAVTVDGVTRHIGGWDALDYTNTHHNWNDTLVARHPERTFEWTVSGIGDTFSLDIRDAQGALLETVALERQ